MAYAYIRETVASLAARHGTRDPYRLCGYCGAVVRQRPMGTGPTAIKGFCFVGSRIPVIELNDDLEEPLRRIVLAHELGHAVLHAERLTEPLVDASLYDDSTRTELEANLFAAELLLPDEAVLTALGEGATFFEAAAALDVPPQLLDFKFRLLRDRGGFDMHSPVNVYADFLRRIR